MAALWRFDAIGTRWEIETDEPLGAGARARVEALIRDFDETWSRFRPDSRVSVLAASGGRIPLPADADAMLDVYRELSDATDGAVNPLIGDALARRGYDPEYSLVDRGAAIAPPDWTAELTWDSAELHLRAAGTIDVGAVGKGRLVDRVLACILPDAAGTVVVDAGGDLAVHGGPVRVGLEHPYDSDRAIGVIEVEDAALCASATNRRAWGDGLHHVLDSRTGVPVRRIAATWALAADALHADAAATALFFEGGPELAARWGVEWVRMATDGRVEWSPAARAEIFR
ncbi:FAD:protein FMN transferase [Microbacterium caowuchunii]|uniref:FAD:protein FMN transferase n=1 Tax=Microbacterium caowuchunii TaxID=2614638 RepID=A0A5N0T7E1_9MICO|nr:FAD:protein FMN transferase [Microbacterium caowuchunii]KAA9130658.1 FAD:protein FMN transferase [Microbacterium caowuchunii]